ncbi:MAG: Omp28-related outer membrane protein [bacterium]|nr:Omp28-related outer membrane protein [bacterium]
MTDPFRTTETGGRAINYYGAGVSTGIPVSYCDGIIQRVGGQAYSTYLSDFNARKAVASPIKIEITGSYNSSAKTGVANIHISNTSGSTVSGTMQCILTETKIAYAWGAGTSAPQDSIFGAARDLIPDQNGDAVSINAGGSIDKTRDFTIAPTWKPGDCCLVVFVQGSNKEIYQAAKVHVTQIGIAESTIKYPVMLKNEPNPFKDKVTISYNIPVTSKTSLEVYDITGKLVKTIVNKVETIGHKEALWDGKDIKGKKMPSGLYFVKLACLPARQVSGKTELTSKVMLLR